MLIAHCRKSAWSDSVEILVSQGRQGGGVFVAQPLTMELSDQDAAAAPTMVLERGAAQFLMDELWSCGLRPSEGSGSAGSLAATQRHLDDMKSIAFGVLRKNGFEL